MNHIAGHVDIGTRVYQNAPGFMEFPGPYYIITVRQCNQFGSERGIPAEWYFHYIAAEYLPVPRGDHNVVFSIDLEDIDELVPALQFAK